MATGLGGTCGSGGWDQDWVGGRADFRHILMLLLDIELLRLREYGKHRATQAAPGRPYERVEAIEGAMMGSGASDLLMFLKRLFSGQPFKPTTDAAQEEPQLKDWLEYYDVCVHYISSLHNQFIAVLSIQGAVAIGCLATIHSLTQTHHIGHLAASAGVPGFSMELALTWISGKLFRQHCVTFWMLARVEQEKLGLPGWASMKTLLGTQGNRLFTAPSTLLLAVAYGLGLGAVLAAGGFAGL
jgi:hypothetical protein